MRNQVFSKMFVILVLVVFNLTGADEITSVVAPVWESGPQEKRTNIVFLSEGYTSGLNANFDNIVQRTFQEMQSVLPFATHMNHFNLYSIWTPSNEAGISEGEQQKDTYYKVKADFCAEMNATEKARTHQLLDSLVPEWSVAVMYYRDEVNLAVPTCADRITITPDKWDGTPTDQSAQEQVNEVLHNFGHILAGLSDETGSSVSCKHSDNRNFQHFSPGALAKSGKTLKYQKIHANQIRNVDLRSLVTKDDSYWKEWIAPSTPVPTPNTNTYQNDVGFFKGNCGAGYRPMMTCKMRSNQESFCKVCSEGLFLSFYDYASPIDTAYPGDILNPKTPEELTFELDLVRAAVQFEIKWKLNGNLIANQDDSTIQLNPMDLPIGNHQLVALVKDTTSSIKIFPSDPRLSAQWEWNITVEPSTHLVKMNLDNKMQGSFHLPYNIKGRRHQGNSLPYFE